MKRLLPILSIAIGLAACNTNADKIAASNPPASIQQAPDTTGFAAFQNMKALNELAAVQEPVQEIQMAATPVRKTTAAPVRKAPKSVASAPKPVATAPAPTTNDNTSPSSSTGSTVSNDTGDGAASAGSGEVAQTEEKKGWSKTAKGAVIGGVTGAAAGAILNKKNRAVGAVIGGVIGAGGGAVIGRQMDKKDGRFLTTGTYMNE